jgi:hypothetical protein
MHPFATDSLERKNIPISLAGLSFGLAYLLWTAIQIMKVPMLWWLDMPSVLGIFWLLYAAFDAWVWRWSVLRRMKVVKIPDLSGEWRGHCASSFDEHCTEYSVEVTIQQTWNDISITLTSASSASHSLSGSILLYQPGGTTLSYEYRNEPKAAAIDSMHSHRGTALLKLVSNGRLEGEYYTGRDRGNYGTIHLRKVQLLN